MLIRPFLSTDEAAVALLVDRAFGPDRRGRTANLLRLGTRPLFGFVAEEAALLVGSVACHPLEWEGADGEVRALILLGPLAVAPGRRNCGIGRALLAAAASELDQRQADAVLIGDAPYYAPFGFQQASLIHWQLPGPFDPERLLLRAARPESWARPALLRPARAAEGAAAAVEPGPAARPVDA
ncbi:MAG: N-acetyltransferase [Sphingomonadaceae bacterium]